MNGSSGVHHGSVDPEKIIKIEICAQHAEPSKAKRSEEVEYYTGPEMTAPNLQDMYDSIEDIVKRTLNDIKLKKGITALTLYANHTELILSLRCGSRLHRAGTLGLSEDR